VQFYPLGADGLPLLSAITPAPGTKAIVVAQLFGLPRSLAGVRGWCDDHGIALVEDCAHSFFGQAGERPVGQWGDLATASLTKFFPVVPEGGLLASARPLPVLALQPAGAKQQVKAWVDLLERSSSHARLGGLNTALRALFRLKNGPPRVAAPTAIGTPRPPIEAEMMTVCDMSRGEREPTALMHRLFRLPRQRIVARRRANYETLLRLTQGLPGARPLFGALPAQAAPYVMPLWVDDPEPAYAALRAAGCAVFRWDRVWPGVPDFADDHGARWRTHVLQLLCHQDLDDAALAQTADVLRRAL
jgi:hypothetical protein